MSELAEKLITKSLKTKNQVLDLGYCGLEGTEEYLDLLAECKNTKKMILSNE